MDKVGAFQLAAAFINEFFKRAVSFNDKISFLLPQGFCLEERSRKGIIVTVI